MQQCPNIDTVQTLDPKAAHSHRYLTEVFIKAVTSAQDKCDR